MDSEKHHQLQATRRLADATSAAYRAVEQWERSRDDPERVVAVADAFAALRDEMAK